jgi:hypothetical protein
METIVALVGTFIICVWLWEKPRKETDHAV